MSEFAWYRNATLRADVFVGEEHIGMLALDEDDDEDDERSYNFEMKITFGDASTDVPDIRQIDAYLKRKFDNERVRVVARPGKKNSGRSLCRRGIYRRAVLRREGRALVISSCRSWRSISMSRDC